MLSDIDAQLNPDNKAMQQQANQWRQLLWEKNRPAVLHPGHAHNDVQAIRNDYENWYASLRSNGVHEPERLTVYRFFAQVNHVRIQNEAAKP